MAGEIQPLNVILNFSQLSKLHTADACIFFKNIFQIYYIEFYKNSTGFGLHFLHHSTEKIYRYFYSDCHNFWINLPQTKFVFQLRVWQNYFAFIFLLAQRMFSTNAFCSQKHRGNVYMYCIRYFVIGDLCMIVIGIDGQYRAKSRFALGMNDCRKK